MYTTGFCNSGLHEGKSPTSPSGKPMKVCTAVGLCACECHRKIDRMYEMAKVERVVQQNPRYVIAPNVDLTWLLQVREDALIADGSTITRPIERPSADVPGLLESARTFTPTGDGYRQRGQLEVEVQRICNRKMAGEFGFSMTPAKIAELIDPDNPPSSGAIGAVFNRWEKIGYAKIHRKPLYFVTYTVEGLRDGLEAVRQRHRRMGGR